MLDSASICAGVRDVGKSTEKRILSAPLVLKPSPGMTFVSLVDAMEPGLQLNL